MRRRGDGQSLVSPRDAAWMMMCTAGGVLVLAAVLCAFGAWGSGGSEACGSMMVQSPGGGSRIGLPVPGAVGSKGRAEVEECLWPWVLCGPLIRQVELWLLHMRGHEVNQESSTVAVESGQELGLLPPRPTESATQLSRGTARYIFGAKHGLGQVLPPQHTVQPDTADDTHFGDVQELEEALGEAQTSGHVKVWGMFTGIQELEEALGKAQGAGAPTGEIEGLLVLTPDIAAAGSAHTRVHGVGGTAALVAPGGGGFGSA